jgi:hypothetical protein
LAASIIRRHRIVAPASNYAFKRTAGRGYRVS